MNRYHPGCHKGGKPGGAGGVGGNGGKRQCRGCAKPIDGNGVEALGKTIN